MGGREEIFFHYILYLEVQTMFVKSFKRLRDGPVVKSPCCSSRHLILSTHTAVHKNLLTPIVENPVPSPDL